MSVHPTLATSAAPDDGDNPLGGFSQCHAGITRQLQALAGLPTLVEAATLARHTARDTLAFVRSVVPEHHAEEEKELFPAVLASATKGEERARVQAMVERLTAEHRHIEALCAQLEPALQAAAKGHDGVLEASVVQRLVDAYAVHAQFEEQAFLPLSQSVLGRNSNHLAALGISLHARHVMPEVLRRYGPL